MARTARRTYLPMQGTPAFAAIHTRAAMYRVIRSYLDDLGFTEVDTPMLYPRPDIAPMPQYAAEDPVTGERLFLRVAPTEHLKRLAIAGMSAAYEISRNFRPGDWSPRSRPEFTSLECTRVGATYRNMMQLTQNLVYRVVHTLTGTGTVRCMGRSFDLTPPWQELTVRKALLRYADLDLDGCRDLPSLRDRAVQIGLAVDRFTRYEALLEAIIDRRVLPNLEGAVFLTEYPYPLSGPAAPVPERPWYKQRCEVFVGSLELANMSSHLNDTGALTRWHEEVLSQHGGQLDEYLLRDIRRGLPPAAVVGIGLDRLLMLLTGAEAIEDVLAFPLDAAVGRPPE